ncbi:histidine phosphatase family protein [Thiomicrorhabdus indica]|uniref:histidine phosphatase family protein n=1 Tax=Thiomicrorhabdus indica TaxID=2267253 RepID=UPI00102DF6B2|nr:phosphoglycerate mutase family protein [Thiomicrorhabdus indica]
MNQDYIFAFLRHGSYHQKPNVPSAWQPYALDIHGIEQSQLAAQKIIEFANNHALNLPEKIFCSNLLRAWETARVLAENFSTPPNIESDSALNERSVGALANLSVKEIDEILHSDPRFEHPGFTWKSDSYYRLPFDGAESLMDAGERVANFIQQQLSKPANHSQLQIFIGHGASFRHAAHLMGILEFEQIKQYSMHYASPMFFKWDAAQQKFLHMAGNWKIRPHFTPETADFTVHRSISETQLTSEIMQWLD